MNFLTNPNEWIDSATAQLFILKEAFGVTPKAFSSVKTSQWGPIRFGVDRIHKVPEVEVTSGEHSCALFQFFNGWWLKARIRTYLNGPERGAEYEFHWSYLGVVVDADYSSNFKLVPVYKFTRYNRIDGGPKWRLSVTAWKDDIPNCPEIKPVVSELVGGIIRLGIDEGEIKELQRVVFPIDERPFTMHEIVELSKQSDEIYQNWRRRQYYLEGLQNWDATAVSHFSG